jgi:hypothetical protein
MPATGTYGDWLTSTAQVAAGSRRSLEFTAPSTSGTEIFGAGAASAYGAAAAGVQQASAATRPHNGRQTGTLRDLCSAVAWANPVICITVHYLAQRRWPTGPLRKPDRCGKVRPARASQQRDQALQPAEADSRPHGERCHHGDAGRGFDSQE